MYDKNVLFVIIVINDSEICEWWKGNALVVIYLKVKYIIYILKHSFSSNQRVSNHWTERVRKQASTR